MHGLTGSQEPRNWRTEELLHVGDDLRHGREAGARKDGHGRSDGTRPGLRGWIGRHLMGVGHVVAGEPTRRPPCPDVAAGRPTTAA